MRHRWPPHKLQQRRRERAATRGFVGPRATRQDPLKHKPENYTIGNRHLLQPAALPRDLELRHCPSADVADYPRGLELRHVPIRCVELRYEPPEGFAVPPRDLELRHVPLRSLELRVEPSEHSAFDDPAELGRDSQPCSIDEPGGADLFDIFGKEDFVCQGTQTDDLFSSNAFPTVLTTADILVSTAARSIYQVSCAFARLHVAMEALVSTPNLTLDDANDEVKHGMSDTYVNLEPCVQAENLADDLSVATKALSRFADAYALLYNFEEDFYDMGLCADDVLHYDLHIDVEEFGFDLGDPILIDTLLNDLGLSGVKDWALIRAK